MLQQCLLQVFGISLLSLLLPFLQSNDDDDVSVKNVTSLKNVVASEAKKSSRHKTESFSHTTTIVVAVIVDDVNFASVDFT